MKVFIKRAFAVILSIALVLTLLPGGFGVDKVEAAINIETIYNENNVIKYDLGDKNGKTSINSGAILVPEKEGTYPVLFMVHGSGGVKDNFYSAIAHIMNNAVNYGYIDPMVVVMPTIPQLKDPKWGVTDFGEYTSKGLCKRLVKAIKEGNLGKYVTEGTWNSSVAGRIDGNAPMSITGYSMGGAEALYVGCSLKNDDDTLTFINVGACSPSRSFYGVVWDKDQKKNVTDMNSWLPYPEKMIYSDNPKGHFWMSYGKAEDSQFSFNVSVLKDAFKQTDTINKFKILDGDNAFDTRYGEHGMKLFYVEMFSFLYYIKNEEAPTPEIIKSTCDNLSIEGTGKEGIRGVVSLSGTNKIGETLTASVSDSNASDFNYQWRRGKNNINGATSDSYKLTSADAGKKISCKVTDKSGTLTGFVSGYVYAGEESGTTPQPEFTVKKKTTDPLYKTHKDKYTLEVTATGQDLNYEWQYRAMGATTWKISDHNVNAPAITIPSATRDIEYQCVVKSGNETKTSGIFKVYVKPIVSAIKTNLTDNKVEEGKDFSITVSAEGLELRYQWMFSDNKSNWTDINGATEATLNTVGGTGGTTGYYKCKVTSVSQTVDSDIVSVSFVGKSTEPKEEPKEQPEEEPKEEPKEEPAETSKAPVIESITPSLSDNTVNMGQYYNISVEATGDDLSYQWMWRTDKKDWATSKCPGSNEATIQLEGKRPVVYYKCLVSNASGTVESKEIQINLANPVLTASVSNNTVKKGQAYTISTNIKDSRFKYSWKYNKHDNKGWFVSQVDGCTTDTLKLEGKNPVITYTCTITYKDGDNEFSVTSDEITITMAE